MALGELFSTSKYLKICMVLTLLQTLLYSIGYSTEYWVSGTYEVHGLSVNFYGGLWKKSVCSDDCLTVNISRIADWLHASRFFATIGLIGFLVINVGVFVCLFTKLSERRSIHILNALVAVGTALCVLATVIIFGRNYLTEIDGIMDNIQLILYHCYNLCVAALILDIIVAILLVLNALQKPDTV